MIVTSRFAIRKNRSDQDKPLEDHVVAEDLRGIYVVCDGVTRSLVNGAYPQDSTAQQAASLFAEIAYQVLARTLETASPGEALRTAVVAGNDAIRRYNMAKFSHVDYLENDLAGTVAIIGVCVADAFHYAFIGDCCCYSVFRDDVVRITSPQTTKVAAYRASAGSTTEATLTIRREFRNNKQSAFGYGVFTGEPQALEFVEYGQIPLAAGQTIVLASDGVAALFDSAPHTLYETSPEVILAEAEEFEAGQKMRSDDKSLIIVQIS